MMMAVKLLETLYAKTVTMIWRLPKPYHFRDLSISGDDASEDAEFDDDDDALVRMRSLTMTMSLFHRHR